MTDNIIQVIFAGYVTISKSVKKNLKQFSFVINSDYEHLNAKNRTISTSME